MPRSLIAGSGELIFVLSCLLIYCCAFLIHLRSVLVTVFFSFIFSCVFVSYLVFRIIVTLVSNIHKFSLLLSLLFFIGLFLISFSFQIRMSFVCFGVSFLVSLSSQPWFPFLMSFFVSCLTMPHEYSLAFLLWTSLTHSYGINLHIIHY